jgi:hypothetical protein
MTMPARSKKVSVAVLVMFVAMATFAALHLAAMPQSRVETADPITLHLGVQHRGKSHGDRDNRHDRGRPAVLDPLGAFRAVVGGRGEGRGVRHGLIARGTCKTGT